MLVSRFISVLVRDYQDKVFFMFVMKWKLWLLSYAHIYSMQLGPEGEKGVWRGSFSIQTGFTPSSFVNRRFIVFY